MNILLINPPNCGRSIPEERYGITSLKQIFRGEPLALEEVDWFLPHISSEYFREPLLQKLQQMHFYISADKWFTNLVTKGNTGAASFFIMLEELFCSGKLRKGDRILGMVPESGRFSVGWIKLTVV